MLGSKKLQIQLITWAKVKEKIAIIETETGKEITYFQLFLAVVALKRSFGHKSQSILIALPGGIIDSAIWLTCLLCGHKLIPISSNLTNEEFQQAVKKHQPDRVITTQNLTEIEEIIKDQAKGKLSEFAPTDGQVYLATSGSTGTPKGVILNTTQIVLTADNIRKSHKITSQDRGLTPLPFYHVNAPVVSLITSMLAGSTLIIAPKYSTHEFWDWVEKFQPTWISLVPTMIAMLLNTDKPVFLPDPNLRFIRTASEPLPAINLKRFEEKFGIPVIETYGLSEAASTIFANPVPPGTHKSGSVGLPLGVKVQIRAPHGEIWVSGPNVIKKYENNQSPESFVDGFFSTGDLGFLDKDGYLHITGRIKDIIIRGGENISPKEIEEVLLTFPAVQEAAVVGQPDPIYGEQVVAFVILTKHSNNINDKIKQFIAQKLTSQKIPTKIHILDSFPRNKTGKIDKLALRHYQ